VQKGYTARLSARAIEKSVQDKQVKYYKTLTSPSAIVYRKVELAPPSPSDFELPSCGRLSRDNRWVKMAELIPWSEFESEYAENFPERNGWTSQILSDGVGGLNH